MSKLKKNWPKMILIGIMVLLVLSLVGCNRSGKGTVVNDPGVKETTAVQGSGTAKPRTLAEILDQGKKATDIYCEYVIRADGGNILQGKLWIAGDNLRSESVEGNNNGTAIFIHNGSKGYSYMYTSGQKQAIKATDSQPTEDINPVRSLFDVQENTPTLGKEVRDGKNCVVVQYKQDEVGTRMWLWEDQGLPVRIESTYDNSTTVMEYKNYKLEALPASLFDLPPGMEVVELPGMGGGMP